MGLFIKVNLDIENINKIEGMKVKYKELGFNYDRNQIINFLINGQRPILKIENEDHKNKLIKTYFDADDEFRIILDFKCLGYYLIYKKNDLEFKPCKFYEKIIKKEEWIEDL